MSNKTNRCPLRFLRIGREVFTIDTSKLPPRDLKRLLSPTFGQPKDPAKLERFYDSMAPHLEQIEDLYNLKLSEKIGSARYIAVQEEMRHAVKLLIGSYPFERFVPNDIDDELDDLQDDRSLHGVAMWDCYWVVDALDALVQEHHDDEEWKLGNYHQSVCSWWTLVECHGLAAVNYAIGARLELPI